MKKKVLNTNREKIRNKKQCVNEKKNSQYQQRKVKNKKQWVNEKK